jgi:transposase
VLRQETSAEGAAGTVNTDYFKDWVEHFLCPTVGNYANGEPRSIVVMDNASTHMSRHVSKLIQATGAIILYTAPYSPDLNPIELGFNVYKSHLKRIQTQFRSDWFQTHLRSLNNITRDTCIKEFRRCEVPMSEDMLTTDEENTLSIMAIGTRFVIDNM